MYSFTAVGFHTHSILSLEFSINYRLIPKFQNSMPLSSKDKMTDDEKEAPPSAYTRTDKKKDDGEVPLPAQRSMSTEATVASHLHPYVHIF
jgi:hypothetical protein